MLRLIFLGTLLITASACARPHADGAELVVAKGCIACHGTSGKATAPSYPNLDGQWERYLRLQLMAYRSGERQNGIMNGMAATLTDEEIRALAAYYGR
ncbi:MAG: cytochrome c [Gammaproteobacteria bacterium]|nr:cytochrome c [Gammaproteobacteria bacterium]